MPRRLIGIDLAWGEGTERAARSWAGPGFVGEAISQTEWGELLRWVWGLQRALLR